MLNDIRGAIFDMDGTLVNSLIIWNIIWEKLGVKFFGEEGFRPSSEIDAAVRTMTLSDAADFVYEEYSLGESGEEVLEEMNKIIADFYRNDVELKDGVREFLEYCKEKGIKMCIASATDLTLLQIAIDHCDIGKYFDAVLSCAEIGKGKDEPDIYLKAMECLGTDVDETCVFEDSLVAICTATDIGMKTVGIYDENNFGHSEMQTIATEYIRDSETLMKLVNN